MREVLMGYQRCRQHFIFGGAWKDVRVSVQKMFIAPTF